MRILYFAVGFLFNSVLQRLIGDLQPNNIGFPLAVLIFMILAIYLKEVA